MAGNNLAQNLKIGADNNFVNVNEIVADPKSLGDVMNNLAIRIIDKTLQEIDAEGLQESTLRHKVSMPVELFGDTFTATLYMADYYDFINQGVKGVGGFKNVYETVTSKKGNRYKRIKRDSQGNPEQIAWVVKATGSKYFYKDKKPPLLFEWAYLKRFNPFVLREIIYHSGITPKYYFDRVLESVNNGEIKRRFVMELNKAGGQAIVKGMKDLFKKR